jgi:hypothetical protein
VLIAMPDETAKRVNDSADQDCRAGDASQKRSRTDAAAVVFACLTVALAGAYFLQTVSDPTQHPFGFALASAWLVSAFSASLTSKVFYRQDPARYHFWGWERDGRLYEQLGLGAFRWALLRSPLIWLNPNVNMRSGRSDFDRLLRSQQAAEGSHAVAGGCTLALAVWCSFTGGAVVGIWLFVINVPLNFYPVMLQRWNRGRVQRARRRLDRLSGRCRTNSSTSIAN